MCGTKHLGEDKGTAEDMAETEQRDPLTDDGESSHSESELKKSIGLKNLQVCMTDISLEQPDLTNGGSVGSGINSNKRKRGRPKGSTVKAAGDMNGGTLKRSKGREESEDSFSPPRKRGRPKGSPKKVIHKTETSDDDGAVQNTPKRGRPKKGQAKGKRGRPKKIDQMGATQKRAAADGTELPRKRAGRPKGSRNKPVLTVRLESTSGRPTRVHVAPDKLNISLPRKNPGKRGRPKKISRGRPRKKPLPPEEELDQPRVWKALGRPRKYPKEDPPEGASSPETPRRGRGRPRKSESKKGAHLKKFNSDGAPNKPPKAAKEQDGPPRKRGRPKGSVKNKTINNSSEKNSQNSDQSKEEAHEDDDISNDVLLEDGF